MIATIMVLTITAIQFYAQYKFKNKSNKFTIYQAKLLKNEMEMCRLRDSLILSLEQNDLKAYNITNELLKDKINQSLEIIHQMKS